MRPSCMDAFGRWITGYNWSYVLDAPTADAKCRLLYSVLQNAVDIYFPAKSIKVCLTDKPWVSSRLKGLVTKRQRALRIHGKDSPIFKRIRNSVKELVKNCKHNYYSAKVASLKDTNISRWWCEVKAIGGLSSTSEWWHQLLSEDTPTIESLCDQFNNLLYSLTSHFAPLDISSLADENLYVPPGFLVTDEKAYKALRSIKSNKSPGPDQVPSRVWKEFAFELAPIVSDLYNSSLREGRVPEILKTSLVIPTPKVTPPKTVEDDLRPITLTSPLAKILEGFTLEHLMNQVAENLDIKQFSMPGRSTTHALVYMLHIILAALDKGLNV
ncbi:uncharacterized protein LOC116611253 [Nematostella vectensis]|uniref:uncharacterized protein LOC116611253 n=1 Tax=Nematostella vectensis TaxID=45351 RepID=UPI00207764EB|nr:uncharacterized protein LOC116611253 [Nematostella vectensis]